MQNFVTCKFVICVLTQETYKEVSYYFDKVLCMRREVFVLWKCFKY